MTSRREFLQIGVTATAWPLVARASHASGIEAVPERTPLLAVVYDTRFPDSVAFARRSEALGVAAHAIDGDMTRLWFEDIHPRWQRSPVAIAGLTAHGPMFCFAELARDVRMRLVFRAEHRPTAGGNSHVFTGPLPMLSAAVGACARPAPLGPSMADVVFNCPGGRTEIGTAAIGAGGVAGEDALYTWVIAPAVRA